MSEKMIVTFLGTSSAPPQADRSQSSVSIKYRGHNLLVDIGEATQNQMIKNKISFKNLTILITHLHSDHTLGLMGLLSTKGFYNIKTPITIIGPPWTNSFIFLQMLAFRFYPEYEIKVIESEGGIVLSNNEFYIEAFRVPHSNNSLGYKIITHKPLGTFNAEKAMQKKIPKGKLWKKLQEGFPINIDDNIIFPSEVLDKPSSKSLKIVITGDTRIDQNVINNASGADLLIHDATYPPNETARARKYLHSTCVDAANVAKFAGVKKLALTHISSLHANLKESLSAAQNIFPESFLAYDGLQVVLDSKEK